MLKVKGVTLLMCRSVINASEMQTTMQGFFPLFFFHFYFCLLMFALILKCCCILLGHNIETTDIPQRQLCRGCRETLNSTVRAELWSVPKHGGQQARRRPTRPQQERQVAQKKPLHDLMKLLVECVLKKKDVQYKRVYFVWNIVWVSLEGRGAVQQSFSSSVSGSNVVAYHRQFLCVFQSACKCVSKKNIRAHVQK